MPMATNFTLHNYFNKVTSAAPLSTFRICFGLLMSISIIRFWYNGWIEKLYLEPSFHFKYFGFSWVVVPDEIWCYLLFIVCGISAFSFAIGYKTRISILTFFLSFTYIELMDKTTYLNHYYFVSVISLILIFLSSDRYLSIDAYLNPQLRAQYIPKWNTDIIKFMLTLVYFYAGIAKLNWDWMVNAMPLTIWLPTKFNIPLIGGIMHEKWVHYLFSWGGAIYDICIPFLLMYKRTRLFAFVGVLIFHILTRVLFPIGMFPYIMIFATLIFFSPDFHNRLLAKICKLLKVSKSKFDNGLTYLQHENKLGKTGFYFLCAFMAIQVLLPLRYLAYPGNIFWTEEGYRFSWRVMLMEKTGYANFKIVNGKTGKRFYVQNEDFLTAFQQKQMSTQPDFIVEYAHYLGNHFSGQGHQNVEVYVESFASLNGRKNQPFIKPEVDLLTVKNSLKTKDYIIPLYE